MANIYEAIATQTLASATSSVTFSSIPSTYTDLVLVCQPIAASATDGALRINSDTGTNYSITSLYGQTSSAGSYRRSNASFMDYDYYAGIATTVGNQSTIHFMNYANTTTYKTVLLTPRIAATNPNAAEILVGLWRSTSAITSITLGANSGFSTNFSIGSTFSLYGIKAA